MAFISKLWKDRVSEYANRRKLIDSSSNESIVTVQRYEGQITEEGDAFNATNMNDLESRIADGINGIGDSLSTVATTGSYNDLTNKPSINNGTLTIQKNGTSLGTFTANAASNTTVNVTVPTNTSDLTNNSGFNTKHGIDPGRVLVNVSGQSSINWTAGEDCMVMFVGAGAYTFIYIDDVAIFGAADGSYATADAILMKSGSNIRATAAQSYSCNLKVYALK